MPAGAKEIEIDWLMVDEMLENMCTGTEVAARIGCHPETLYDRVKERYCTDFSEYKRQKRSKTVETLRSKQIEMAKSNPTMSIWLGKQYLEQSDKSQTENANVTYDLSKLPKEYLKRIVGGESYIKVIAEFEHNTKSDGSGTPSEPVISNP